MEEMTPKEMIKVEKEVYEAVLRNSVRVNDLEAENHKLKEINLWHSEKSWDCEKEKQQLKELLREWVQFEIDENPNDFTVISERMSELANKTKQAIGEKK